MIPARSFVLLHSILVPSAFISALVIGYRRHFYELVKNEFFQYPDEWFPTVSAVTGDHYPEKHVYMVLMALSGFARFSMIFSLFVVLKSHIAFFIQACSNNADSEIVSHSESPRLNGTFKPSENEATLNRKAISSSVSTWDSKVKSDLEGKLSTKVNSLNSANLVAMIMNLARAVLAACFAMTPSRESLHFHVISSVAYFILSLVFYCTVIYILYNLFCSYKIYQSTGSKEKRMDEQVITESRMRRLYISLIVKSFLLLVYVVIFPIAAWLLVRHKARVSGAYSWYAVLEWLFVAIDLTFDGSYWIDVEGVHLKFLPPVYHK